MKKWEYHLLMHEFRYGDIDERHVHELSSLGRVGWELVSMTRINEEQAQYTFKRPIE